MDRTLQSQVFGGSARSPYTPRTRQSSASSVVSGRRSLHSVGGLKKSSASGRFSLSGRSNQSVQIVARSEYNVVECYGQPLPVLVNEALTFSERNTSVSINCNENGWAWAVYGRRLLVWQYRDLKFDPAKSFEMMRTPQRRTTTAQCRELTLPHCDIGHKASLITVFMPDGQQMASCLAVSPTGDVRYWPSIAHDGSSIDSTGILEGQEFDYLLNIPPVGYVLVTTTCSLVLLQLQLQNGRHTIQHKTIKPPSGFFGGIGKKFASIIIGMNNSQDKENKFVKVAGIENDDDEWTVTVLADRWLQQWKFSDNGSEQFLFEDHEIIRRIREEFHKKFWSGRETTDIEILLLDIQAVETNIFVLAGALNNNHAPQIHYAIVSLNPENDSFKINTFNPLKLTLYYSPETENDCLKMRFITNRGIAYLYNERSIFPTNLSNCGSNEIEVEKIEFQSQGDRIMNAAVCSNLPLFFSRNHGLVCVSPSDFDPGDFLNNSSFSPDVFTPPLTENQTVFSPNVPTSSGNLIMYELDPDEIYNANKDVISQVKAAFIYNLKRNNETCNSILRELFPPDGTMDDVDSLLDKTIASIAQDLADDIPAADPRWEQDEMHFRHSLGSSSSLQIAQQLKEKNLAMNHFVEFLHSTGLWARLGAVTSGGIIKSTCHTLADINEKIIAAISLKGIQNNYSKLVDEAIQNVLILRNEQPTGSLVHQDVFYVRVTRIQEIFRALVDIADKCIESQYPTSQISSRICDVNSIILSMLIEILNFRDKKSELYALPEDKTDSFEYMPWTTTSGKNGLRDTLLHLIDITLKHGARITGEPELRQKLYVQMMDLIDFVLDGRRRYLDSIKGNAKYAVCKQQYESQRSDLIYPLVDDGQLELAAKLAEKYLDFNTLVLICDQTENQERLDSYIERYKEYDFASFAINWHMRHDHKGDLFERFKGSGVALSRFLGDHPSLAWIQHIFNGELDRAGYILFNLGQNEVELVARKKTILSLAKLAALAAESETSSLIAEINTELMLIDYQDQLPESVLTSFGYDTDNPKVLKAEEIINLFISEENETANEFDFRKALELIYYVDDPDDARHKIWCAAILRDSWTSYNMNSPLECMQNMLFFKLIDVCYLMDGDLEKFLPPMEEFLTTSELSELSGNKSFQYLLKLGYEHISESYRKKDM
ncbi:nuclear pore complex protein Nup133 [Hermetia illucens]|uniref:nuclear pore complex protein Nup133 n=1 Tax=Hermetia illucens TaxID=343691 RepID=UPI0018CBF833|nr:nuclear pore complex protein Nup133 [Hermetia illucens]